MNPYKEKHQGIFIWFPRNELYFCEEFQRKKEFVDVKSAQ
jgi:hypothetical protein